MVNKEVSERQQQPETEHVILVMVNMEVSECQQQPETEHVILVMNM